MRERRRRLRRFRTEQKAVYRQMLDGPLREDEEMTHAQSRLWAYLVTYCRGSEMAHTAKEIADRMRSSPRRVFQLRTELVRLFGKPIAANPGPLGKVAETEHLRPAGLFVVETQAEVVLYVEDLSIRIAQIARLRGEFLRAAKESLPPEQLTFEGNDGAERARLFLGPQDLAGDSRISPDEARQDEC